MCISPSIDNHLAHIHCLLPFCTFQYLSLHLLTSSCSFLAPYFHLTVTSKHYSPSCLLRKPPAEAECGLFFVSYTSTPRHTCSTCNLTVLDLCNFCTHGRRNARRRGENVSVFAYRPCSCNANTACISLCVLYFI
jgi:hypothetical protein